MDHESHAVTYLRLLNMSFQFIFALVLVNFRSKSNDDELGSSSDADLQSLMYKLPKLNSYFLSLHEKLSLDEQFDLYKIDSILEDYLSLTVKYLGIIENDSWSSSDLADTFAWLSDTFLRKLIQMSAQVDARDSCCAHFVALFRNFTLLFAIDFELINSKVIYILTYLRPFRIFISCLRFR